MVDEGLGDDSGQVLLLPLLRGHVLLKNHHLLEVHLLELFGIFQDYRSQNVQAKPEVIVLVRQVRIEQPHAYLYRELPQKQASHPLEVHVVEVDLLLLKMSQQLRIHSPDDFLHPAKGLLDPRPRTRIVV